MKTNAPKPLKDHLRTPINGLQSSVASLIGAAKGQTETRSPAERAADGIADAVIKVSKAPRGPLAGMLLELADLAGKIGAAYNELPADLILDRETGPVGLRSMRGKSVVPAANTPVRFKEFFGSSPRVVEDEFEDPDTGTKLLQVEGLVKPVPHSYLVSPKKDA